MITHLKIFTDLGFQQVALFNGPDHQNDWQENLPLENVLIGNWQLLPNEELISISDLAAKGILNKNFISKYLATNKPKFLIPDLFEPGFLNHCLEKSINLHIQLADQAANDSDLAKETQVCLQAADFLFEFLTSKPELIVNIARNSYISFLLRAVDVQIKLWQVQPVVSIAIQISDIFAELSELTWASQDDFPKKANANQLFWLRQAISKQLDIAVAAEENDSLAEAATAYILVLQLQQSISSLLK
jgi:hypothetical protein